MYRLALVIYIGTVTTLVNADDMFSSTDQLADLMKTETFVVESIKSFIADEEKRLQLLKENFDKFRNSHIQAVEEGQTYFDNPLNGYLLIKRLTVDWEEIKKGLNSSEGFYNNLFTKINESLLKFPNGEDHIGVSLSILRLQKLYQLNASDLAKGKIMNVQTSAMLNTQDSYFIGQQAYKIEMFSLAIDWFSLALIQLRNEIKPTIEPLDILEKLALPYQKIGNRDKSLETIVEMLKIDPNYAVAIHLKDMWMNYDYGDIPSICGKESNLPAEISSKLKCRFNFKNDPYYRIGPFKEEDVYLEPHITLYHDVLKENEIETLRKLHIENLTRSAVGVAGTFSDIRVSKTVWLQDYDHPIVSLWNKRLSVISELKDVSSKLSLANYGIGGHYAVHYDSTNDGDATFSNGNRIATTLGYVSDVLMGGNTVFPLINVSVKPKKGSVVLWKNLFPSGNQNKLTLHSGCPVVMGSKWVVNKWFYSHGQEFVYPCKLDKFAPF